MLSPHLEQPLALDTTRSLLFARRSVNEGNPLKFRLLGLFLGVIYSCFSYLHNIISFSVLMEVVKSSFCGAFPSGSLAKWIHCTFAFLYFTLRSVGSIQPLKNAHIKTSILQNWGNIPQLVPSSQLNTCPSEGRQQAWKKPSAWMEDPEIEPQRSIASPKRTRAFSRVQLTVFLSGSEIWSSAAVNGKETRFHQREKPALMQWGHAAENSRATRGTLK